MKTYEVTCILQYPAWDEKDGFTVEVTAKSKSDAIKSARRDFESRGLIGCGQGRYTMKAVEVENVDAEMERMMINY